MCPIALLLIYCLRHSLIADTKVQEVLDRAVQRSDRTIAWLFPEGSLTYFSHDFFKDTVLPDVLSPNNLNENATSSSLRIDHSFSYIDNNFPNTEFPERPKTATTTIQTQADPATFAGRQSLNSFCFQYKLVFCSYILEVFTKATQTQILISYLLAELCQI